MKNLNIQKKWKIHSERIYQYVLQLQDYDTTDILKIYDIAKKHIKHQKLCILLFLHLSILFKHINADILDNFKKFSRHNKDRWFGIKAFTVIHPRFYLNLKKILPDNISQNSINNVFRRCGFVPDEKVSSRWKQFINEETEITFIFNGMKN